MRLNRVAILVVTCAAGAVVASAGEAYVVRYDTSRAPVPFPPCGGLVYRDELIFHNSGGSDAVISLLGVSNGMATQPQSLPVPAGGVRSSEGGCERCSAPATWAPDPQPML